MKQYSVTLQIIYLIIGLITGTMLFLVRKTVVSWYIISAEAEYLALGFIIILSVTVIGTSYEMAGLTEL